MMPSLESSATLAAPPTFARSRPCILDPRLALSAPGPIAAARLSSECSVWMPRELRETMKSARAFRAQPDKLAPRVYGAQSRVLPNRDHEIRSALGQWTAWLHGSLSTLRFFYLGENAGESVVPPTVDRSVHDRFEQLAAGLDALAQQANYDLPRGEAITACFRDAAALCVALAPYGAFVLAALEADGRSAPAMCNYVDAWGLRVSDVTARAARRRGPRPHRMVGRAPGGDSFRAAEPRPRVGRRRGRTLGAHRVLLAQGLKR